MKHPVRFAGIGGHHSSHAKTEEWLTPPAVLEAIGGARAFGLDPCSPVNRPWPTARHHFTIEDNGLIQDWRPYGPAFVNPPYTPWKLRRWLARTAEHNDAIALIFARTETDAFFRYVWQRATALRFIRSRLTFHYPDGSPAVRPDGRPANAGGPSVLIAYGPQMADVLAECSIPGQFVPLLIPRSVLIEALAPTWSEALAEFFAGRTGPVRLDELYASFAATRKAAGNPNFKAKLRQQLQFGPYRRVDRGMWARQSVASA